jgi:metallophosphoesterase (TIGR00282 family)
MKEIYPYLDQKQDLLRPANFPSGVPGTGVTTFQCNNVTVGVINVQGRVFMKELVSCPFRAVESILTYLHSKTNIIIVDFHAETSSEKMGLAHFLDGKVSAVFGTHTHVQTADERILPGGTAFMTDAGMVGSLNGMLGMKKEAIVNNFLTQMPTKFTVDTSMPLVLCGVFVDIDTITGKAVHIERIKIIDQEVSIIIEDDKEKS